MSFDPVLDYPLGSRRPDLVSTLGGTPLAESLERAAELVLVPDDELLEIYTALRPGRSTASQLESWAARLDGYSAERTAAFVREAAAAYEERGLLARA